MSQLKKAVAVLDKEGIVAYPTETVYGLGANGLRKKAVEKVFKLKKRSRSQPISLAVADFTMMNEIAFINSNQNKKLKKVLPGPITIIARKKDIVPDIVTAGSNKVGIRFPNHRLALNLIKEFRLPITATSANISGYKPATNYKNLCINPDYIVEGTCNLNQPSTVYDLVLNKIIRKGAGDKQVLFLK